VKKKLIILLTVITFSSSIVAQINVIFSDDFTDSVLHNQIGVWADGSYNSNCISNEFVNKFYKGGYISNELKDGIRNNLKNKNRFGADINYSIYGSFKLDSLFPKKELTMFVALKNREHFDTRFSKDFYNLAFYGNSPFAGKTLSLNDFNINLIRYQQLQLGIFSSKLDSAARWGIGVSFLKGEQYLSMYAKKAELFTSDDGQYIDFDSDIYAAISDTNNSGLGAFNGFGASADIYFEAPFQTKFGKSKIKASVSDVGFIKFNKETITVHQDSLFHYAGIYINNIYDLQDSAFSILNQDIIINGIVQMKKQKGFATLPATLNVSFETRFNKYFRLHEGVRYVYNANYSLLVYLRGDFYIKPNIMLSTVAAYGGYGKFNYGLNMHAQFGKLSVIAGTNNIEGLIVPKKTNGLSAFTGLSFSF